MSEMEKKNVVFDLPEDIIFKILCRLPVKSLIRFTCVSKRWRSVIISDPQFAKFQLKLASQRKTLCHRFLVSTLFRLEPFIECCHIECQCDFSDSSEKKAALSELHTQFRTIDLEAPAQFGDASSVKILTSPFEGHVKPMVTCNGLVILGDDHCTNLSIWNPSTAFFRKIPDPGIWAEVATGHGYGRYDIYALWGFGYVSATDDYRLVILLHHSDDDDGDDDDDDDLPFVLDVHIFSVRDNSWKIVQVPGNIVDWIFSRKGVLANEVIHWIMVQNQETGELVISAFDLTEEEFQKEPLLFPADVDYNIDDFRTEIELGCIDGCLQFYSMNTGRDIEVWVMREYRVRKSWIKLFKFSLYDIPNVFGAEVFMSQFFVLESGSVFINSYLKEFIRIECHKEDKPVLSGRYRMEKWELMNLGLWDKLESLRKDGQDADFLKVMFYEETLVSVPE